MRYFTFKELPADSNEWNIFFNGKPYKRVWIEDDSTQPTSAEIEPIADEPVPENIQSLIEQRNTARQAKDFVLADRLRDEIQGMTGKRLIDKPNGGYLLI